MLQRAKSRSMIASTSPTPACAWASRPGVRILVLATLVALLATAAVRPSAQAADSPNIAPEQELVTLLESKGIHAHPVFGSPTLAGVSYYRPLTLVHTTLPVLAQMTDDEGREWLRVRLPGRAVDRKAPPPTGWITADYTRMAKTVWHLVVEIRTRRVLAYRDGQLVRTFTVIVGKPSTPTPRGDYFIEEGIRLPPHHLEAPGALATSARSHVFKEFMGGLPQIALHGMVNIGGKMGTAVSNGCIRMTSTAIVWLRKHIRAGVPLTIR
jgi:lipoprotein-anchoring transpeptidase ErfK/SrfK